MVLAHSGLNGNPRLDESLLRLIEVDMKRNKDLSSLTSCVFSLKLFRTLVYCLSSSTVMSPAQIYLHGYRYLNWTAASPSKFGTLSSALNLEVATSTS
jgi:hypothetical protein